MLEDKQYELIEQYINGTLVGEALRQFEKELADNPLLAQTVALYRDVPEKLEDVEQDLKFNELIKAVGEKQQGKKVIPRNRWRRWGSIISIAALFLLALFNWSNISNWLFPTSEKEMVLALESEVEERLEGVMELGTKMGTTSQSVLYTQLYKSYKNKAYDSVLFSIDSLTNFTSETQMTQKILLQGLCYYHTKAFSEAIELYDSYRKAGA